MTVIFRSFLVLSLLVTLNATASGQQRANAADAVDELRLQLIELQEKEGSLRIRAQQLDEELKPENIIARSQVSVPPDRKSYAKRGANNSRLSERA